MNPTAKAILIRLVERAQANGWKYLFTNPNTGKWNILAGNFHKILVSNKVATRAPWRAVIKHEIRIQERIAL